MRSKAIFIVVILVLAGAALGAFLLNRTPAQSAPPSRNEPARPVPQTTPPPSSQKIEPPRSTEVSKAPPADYQPPKTVDPKLAALVDRRAPEDARISSDISARLPRVQNAADFPALIQVLSDAQDDDTVRNEVANLLRRSGYFTGTAETLMKVLDNPAEKARFRSFAVQHLYGCLEDNKNSAPQPAHPPGQGALVHPDYTLSAEEQQKITDHLHTYLTDRDVEVRREALLALVRLKDPLAAPTAVAWLNQPGPEADRSRDLAIRCVHDLDLRDQIPTIRKYAHDPNEVIRIAAIVALSEWNDEESRPAFEEAAQSKVERLKRAGKAALARLKTDAK